MKKPEITSGEWDINGGLVISDKNGLIADAEIHEIRRPEDCKKNAQAIAAVPDMIDALIEAYEMHGNAIQELGYDPSKDPTIGKIKQALIKAGYTE